MSLLAIHGVVLNNDSDQFFRAYRNTLARETPNLILLALFTVSNYETIFERFQLSGYDILAEVF